MLHLKIQQTKLVFVKKFKLKLTSHVFYLFHNLHISNCSMSLIQQEYFAIAVYGLLVKKHVA